MRSNTDFQARMKSFVSRVGLLLLSVAVCSVGLAQAPDEAPAPPSDTRPEGLPKLKDMELPSAQSLLTERPRDWVVLYTDEVLQVESLVPRPNLLETQQKKLAAKIEERLKALGEAREKLTEEIDALSSIVVTVAQGGDRQEYRLPLKFIKQIIHHEDLMMQRIRALLAQNQTSTALELLTRLQRDRPDWAGVKEMGQEILFLDAGNRAQAGNPEGALVLLDELHQEAPQYQGLSSRYGEVIQKLVNDALAQQDYLRAQYFLRHLQQRFANHPVFQEIQSRLAAQALNRMQAADAAAAKNEFRNAAILAEEAVAIWPRADELRAPYKQRLDRFPRLHVGVTSLPGECRAYPLPGDADERKAKLTQMKLFEVDRIRDGTAYYRTRFFDEWEPRDLGRQMRFTLRQFRQPSELQATVFTPDVVTPLLQRLDRHHPAYDERFAAIIESVEVPSPQEFTLTFRRVPPRLEPLLARLALLEPNPQDPAQVLLLDPGGFRVEKQTPAAISYIRKLPEPDGLPRYHVAEVIEHRYESSEKIVRGLELGEVSMAPDLPDAIIRRLQADNDFLKRFFIQPCQQPVTHLLQFTPQSQPLQVPELRKALTYAVDRERLLKEIVLEDPDPHHGRLVTTPFLSTNPGRNVLVESLRPDLSAAVALALAARQKLKNKVPPLTMIVAPGAIPEAVAAEIARTWRRIGLQIEIVHSNEPPPRQWDILYRTLQMNEPLLDMWPFLTFTDQAKIEALDVYPDWLKQELVQLDRISDQALAVESLQKLHRHLADDAAYIPLWEVDRFLVFRKTIQGFPQRPVHCYDEIDRWVIEPWYRTELP